MSNYSAAPGVPQTASKATAAAVVGFLVAFIGALAAAVAGRTDLDTLKWEQWLVVILTAAATALGAGGAAYQAKNRAL